MTIMDRIEAAIATRNAACVAAYNATMVGATMLAQEPVGQETRPATSWPTGSPTWPSPGRVRRTPRPSGRLTTYWWRPSRQPSRKGLGSEPLLQRQRPDRCGLATRTLPSGHRG